MTLRERAWLLPPAAACLSAGILLGRICPVIWPGLAGCALALAAVIIARSRLRFAALLALFLSLGLAAASAAFHPALPPESTVRVRGIVADEVQAGQYGQIKTVLRDVTLDGAPYSSGAYWSFYPKGGAPSELLPGKQVDFTADIYHPSGASNPGGYDFREDLLRRGINIGVYGDEGLTVSDPGRFSFFGAAAALRHELAENLIKNMGELPGRYAAAMLLGMRSLVPDEDRLAFNRLGIAHVLSVSGFHVGILIGMLGLLFRLLRMPQPLRLVLLALMLFAYGALCGFGQPVLRASLLALLTLSGRLLNRPRSGLHLLSLVWTALLLISPVQLTGAGFLLSFGAMLGLVVVTPYINRLVHFVKPVPRKLWSLFAAGLGAQIGILLPELYFFQELPLLGLLVNIPVSLIASLMILSYWLVLIFMPVPFLAAPAAAASAWLTEMTTGLVRALGAAPGITLWTPAANLVTALGAALIITALCCLLRLKARVRLTLLAAGVAVTVLSLMPFPHTGTEYIQLSAGNADAAVLHDCDRVIVIDAGERDGVLSGYLHRRRLTPDAVILTHLHTDHINGLLDMMEDGIPIRVCYLPYGALRADIHPDAAALIDRLKASGTDVRYLSRGDTLPLPSGAITVLWPEAGAPRDMQDANESSLVLAVDMDGVRLLQAGDLDGRYERYTAEPADILKIAHHGSASSASPEFLEAVSPRAILLTCSKPDRHYTVEEKAGGVPVYSTALGGALTVRFSPDAFSIEPFIKNSPRLPAAASPLGEGG